MAMRKNRFYYYYRLIKYRMLQDRSPIAAALKITQRCNLRCRHCAWEKKTENELSFEDWKRIIDSLYSKGVTVIAVEGGEPTLHPGVSDIVDIEPFCEFFSPLLSGIMFNFVYPYGNIKEEALKRGERIATAEKLMKLKKSYVSCDTDSALF
jgi:2-iminoacetate synthase ThiH